MVSSCTTSRKMEKLPVHGVSEMLNLLIKHHLTNTNVWKYLAADLKTGKVYRGEPEKNVKADTTLTIDDSDMIDLVSIFLVKYFFVFIRML